ncbi:hypothetical protein Bbelb_099290 [Branchiostoma belcheri]|nr:hypothetical protein Bbelb_099290 [Branchiostoma belcheri]
MVIVVSLLKKPTLQQKKHETKQIEALKPSDSSKKTSRNSQLDRTKTVNISIPYIQGVSEKIRRILHNYNIATNFKPCRTLRQMLFHPKDKLKNCVKSDVIYRLKCEDHQCKETYIGETSQPLKERYKQHCRASNSGFSSAIWHRLDKHKGHSFHLESADILDREARWFERGVGEAIYERLCKPSLNRKGGLRPSPLYFTSQISEIHLARVLSLGQGQKVIEDSYSNGGLLL